MYFMLRVILRTISGLKLTVYESHFLCITLYFAHTITSIFSFFMLIPYSHLYFILFSMMLTLKNVVLYLQFFTHSRSQFAPDIFNLDQKFHGLSCFWGIYIYETVQKQSRKTSAIRLPKFTTVDITRKCRQRASFGIENLFF